MKENNNQCNYAKEVLKVIASHSRFSFKEIETAYNCLKSFDDTIKAIDDTDEYNISLREAAMRRQYFANRGREDKDDS